MLTDNEVAILESLEGHEDKWLSVRHVGGTDRSHHGGTLTRLYERGLVDCAVTRVRTRSTRKFRINAKGQAALDQLRGLTA